MEEFEYSNPLKPIKSLLLKHKPDDMFACSEALTVKFSALLKLLHLPVLHYKHQYSSGCPSNCVQQDVCKTVRDIVIMIEDVFKQMSRTNKLFDNIKSDKNIIIVGSVKENTKIGEGQVDELDILIILDQKYKVINN